MEEKFTVRFNSIYVLYFTSVFMLSNETIHRTKLIIYVTVDKASGNPAIKTN